MSNAVGNQIWAIDTASNQIAAMIPTAALGFVGVSISPDGSRLYAASIGNPSVVEVINPKTNDVVTSIALPGSEVPTRIALTPDGGHAYVTGDVGHVWLIDTQTKALVATISIATGQPLLDIAFLPDGTRAYITCGNNNAIYVLDTTTSRVSGQITSSYPGGLAISSNVISVQSRVHSLSSYTLGDEFRFPIDGVVAQTPNASEKMQISSLDPTDRSRRSSLFRLSPLAGTITRPG